MSVHKVSVRRLVKRFGATLAADHINLDIQEGEFLTLLGASGCGKTTLMRMIAGFEKPDAGRVEIDGRDVTPLPPRERRLGMLFQQYSLFPHMTVAENIGYGLRAQRVPEAQAAARVAEMLDLVQLPHVRDRRPSQLSGGQQQRIALARALATRPSLLMLDEPLGALDLKLRRQLQNELRRIHRETGTTFLFVTHDQEEALHLSDRIAVMRGGRVEQLADPETVYLRPSSAFVADFIGEVSFLNVEVEDGGLRLPGGSLLSVALERAKGPARIAVRPEDVAIAQPGDEGALDAVVEQMAYEPGATLYTLRLAGAEEVKARVLGIAASAARPGDRVGLRLGHRLMAFDR
jgi:ABC-type Fe3+/spermidine/putrescine transport system ATPase subunit